MAISKRASKVIRKASMALLTLDRFQRDIDAYGPKLLKAATELEDREGQTIVANVTDALARLVTDTAGARRELLRRMEQIRVAALAEGGRRTTTCRGCGKTIAYDEAIERSTGDYCGRCIAGNG